MDVRKYKIYFECWVGSSKNASVMFAKYIDLYLDKLQAHVHSLLPKNKHPPPPPPPPVLVHVSMT